MVTVVFIAGLAGTGKSTLGDALAASLGGVHLDFDVVSASVVEHAREDHPGLSEAELLVAVKDERYAALRAALDLHVVDAPDVAVVVSAPFSRQIADPVAWQAWAGVSPDSMLVWLHLDESERGRRITARGASRDRGVEGSAGAALTGAVPSVPHVALDAAQETSALVQAVLGELAEANLR